MTRLIVVVCTATGAMLPSKVEKFSTLKLLVGAGLKQYVSIHEPTSQEYGALRQRVHVQVNEIILQFLFLPHFSLHCFSVEQVNLALVYSSFFFLNPHFHMLQKLNLDISAIPVEMNKAKRQKF